MPDCWALNEEGRVIGRMRAATMELVEANAPAGTVRIIPARPDIDPKRRRHNGTRWVKLPEVKEDWRRIRAKKMPSTYAQNAVTTAVAIALNKDPAFRTLFGEKLAAEIDALDAEITAVKAAIPKT